jgi:hypothetical protein
MAGALEEVFQQIIDARGLDGRADTERLELRTDGSDKPLALALRAAIGVALAREHADRGSDCVTGLRGELQSLWAFLQPAIDGRRRPQIPFPSRRQADHLAYFGTSPEAVARLIGLTLNEAEMAARPLGLRLSTNHHKLNLAPGELDVVVDADAYVTNVIGLHV